MVWLAESHFWRIQSISYLFLRPGLELGSHYGTEGTCLSGLLNTPLGGVTVKITSISDIGSETQHFKTALGSEQERTDKWLQLLAILWIFFFKICTCRNGRAGDKKGSGETVERNDKKGWSTHVEFFRKMSVKILHHLKLFTSSHILVWLSLPGLPCSD